MSLKLKSTEQRVGCFLIKLEGRLDTTTHQQLSSMLDMIFGVPVRAITLDFAGLDYMSSMGLRVLMQLMKRLAAQNGSLLMIHAKDSIKAVLEMANVLPSMSLFASVEEADAYLDTLQKNA
jgi:anti-anti-sigma factor